MAVYSSHLHQHMDLGTKGCGLLPLAPAPLVPSPQVNVPLTLEGGAAEEATSDLHFPARLHYMLTDIHKDGILTDIISWQPHGRCFVVHDKKQFVEKILCLWFRQSKWASFQRQLNMYGFRRLSHGMDKGGYYHDLFLQHDANLAARIQRQKVKGTGPRKPAEPDQEPNFYATTIDRHDVRFAPFHQRQLPCSWSNPTTTVTLRNSLAQCVLPSQEIHPRGIFMWSQNPAEAKGQMETPNFFSSVNRVPGTLNEQDEQDLEALAQLASWF